MEKVKLIYNPFSGMAGFKNSLDYIIERFQNNGAQIVPYRTRSSMDAFQEAAGIKTGEYSKVLVAGGDGTIHQVVNGLLFNNINLPLGIFPVGTANDFANYLGIPRGVKEACDIILRGYSSEWDLGMVNGKYFINIASAGLLTDVSQRTDINLKNNLGKLAYYLKGIEQLPHFHPIEINLKSAACSFKGQVYLFLVMNGRAAGGFPKVAPNAAMQDGLLEVLLFKPCLLPELVALFIKVVKGEHLNSPYIRYFQTKELTIACNTDLITDLDGEKGPAFPLKFSCLPGKIKVFVKEK
ncbi:MAG: YegS/Rv2252/BmrU family lipid kinase [Peptococcaceae bacterium]